MLDQLVETFARTRHGTARDAAMQTPAPRSLAPAGGATRAPSSPAALAG